MAEIGVSSYRRFLQGDQNALSELITAYSDALVRFAYGFVRNSAAAEDVAAESFVVLCMKRKHFPDEVHLRAYLYKIARNKSVDYLRHHRDTVPLDDVENVLGTGDPEQNWMRIQRDETLYLCLQKLPEQYRQVLVLTYLEDFSVKEVCSVLKHSAKQVYNLLARAKVALKELLEKEGITYENL